MLVTYHRICAFPGCGHTALMKHEFEFPTAQPPEAELPRGWSVVLRAAGDGIVTIPICHQHDFTFDGVKACEIKPVGFQPASGNNDHERED